MFQPTGTSKTLINAVKPFIKGGSLLDLGCGSGIVGRSLLGLADIYASDIDKDVCLHVGWDEPIISRSGNLFEPWSGWKFDIIIDDVSGVAEDIAKVSPWFKDVSCESGKDGADLVCEVIKQAPKYLKPEGILFFPIISLSNSQRIKSTAIDTFKNLKLLSHTEFPLPKELQDYPMPKGYIKEMFGIKLFWTDIYLVKS